MPSSAGRKGGEKAHTEEEEKRGKEEKKGKREKEKERVEKDLMEGTSHKDLFHGSVHDVSLLFFSSFFPPFCPHFL